MIKRSFQRDEADASELGMLENNRIEGLIPMELYETGNTVFCTYREDGFSVLESLISPEAGNLYLYAVIYALAFTGKALREHFLDENRLSLLPQEIFIDEAAGKVLFLYNLVKKEPFRESLQRLMEYFLKVINPAEEHRILFLYGLYRKSREEHVLPETLLQYWKTHAPEEKLTGESGAEAAMLARDALPLEPREEPGETLYTESSEKSGETVYSESREKHGGTLYSESREKPGETLYSSSRERSNRTLYTEPYEDPDETPYSEPGLFLPRNRAFEAWRKRRAAAMQGRPENNTVTGGMKNPVSEMMPYEMTTEEVAPREMAPEEVDPVETIPTGMAPLRMTREKMTPEDSVPGEKYRAFLKKYGYGLVIAAILLIGLLLFFLI